MSRINNIPSYLIEAYKGFYDMVLDEAIEQISKDTPKEHLHVYLTWNGILGWDEQIFNVANGMWFNVTR